MLNTEFVLIGLYKLFTRQSLEEKSYYQVCTTIGQAVWYVFKLAKIRLHNNELTLTRQCTCNICLLLSAVIIHFLFANRNELNMIYHKQFDDCTDCNDEKGHLLMFRKKTGKGSTVEGFSWDWTQGAWLSWLFGYSKSAKEPVVLTHYNEKASFLLEFLSTPMISELQGSKK